MKFIKDIVTSDGFIYLRYAAAIVTIAVLADSHINSDIAMSDIDKKIQLILVGLTVLAKLLLSAYKEELATTKYGAILDLDLVVAAEKPKLIANWYLGLYIMYICMAFHSAACWLIYAKEDEEEDEESSDEDVEDYEMA